MIKSFAKNKDARYFKSIKARFADSVFPGETIVTEMWKESDGKVVFRCKVKERDKVVISGAAVEFYDAIPEKKAAPKKPEAAASAAAAAASPAAAPPAGAPGMPVSSDIFGGISRYLAANPELTAKVNTVYLFKLTSPDSAWIVDLKNAGGKVAPSAGEKADCTLELSDADFMAMCTGQADPQKLYFGGKLKISGNVMASQKLEFLKKIDPQMVIAAMKERTGTAAADIPAPTAPPTEVGEMLPPGTIIEQGKGKGPRAQAPDIFEKLKERLAQSPDLAKEVQAVLQFRLTSPSSDWTVDMKTAGGAVRIGVEKGADATLTLADQDLASLASGESTAERLFQTGMMRVDGDVTVAHRLGFLKGLA